MVNKVKKNFRGKCCSATLHSTYLKSFLTIYTKVFTLPYSNIIEINTDIRISSFKLLQNYPNPFNSSTKIKYFIPGVVDEYIRPLHNISLIVYDMLGNKIATLINEPKESGIYEVEFDASNLSSGIYLYTLQAGEYISSKKMILLK